MRTVRLLSLLLAALGATALLSGTALARSSAGLASPQNLKPFLLRASESVVHVFPRTPSFSWAPVRGAYRYEFQLSKTPGFQDGSIFWASSSLRGPAVAISLTLPWMTGAPYAAYARVRAVTSRGTTPWSRGYGFNVRWQQVPRKITSYTGLSRWTPVEGATSYQVWFTGINRVVETRVNAVDQREFYAFHQTPSFTGSIPWRVRAVRRVAKLQGFITPVNYGPWSPTYTSTNPPLDEGVVRPVATTTADATSTAKQARAHEVTPAFVFAGTKAADGTRYGLYRVYAFSDRQCVNTIFRGAIVGGPAYAARNKGTLALPVEVKAVTDAATQFLPLGDEGKTYTAEGLLAQPANESGATPAAGAGVPAAPSAPQTGKPAAPADVPAANASWPQIELLESGWPNGRFFWTVVPVKLAPKLDADGKVTGYDYVDAEVPQDLCASGRVLAFGKASAPVVAGQGSPYASGLSTTGRLIAATGNQLRFYGYPLVAWLPTPGADTYEVEWSPTRYPWRAVKRVPVDGGTAASLPLRPGRWWYRIRGISDALPAGRQFMSWSAPLQLTVAKPTFRLVASR